MKFRTDLALERRELINGDISGVKVEERENAETKTTVIKINSQVAAEKLGKARGKYITLEMNCFSDETPVSDGRLEALVTSLKELLPEGNGTVLVAGVGNADITSDSLGPLTASYIFATRHINDEMRKIAGFTEKLRAVAVVCSGVLGKTGIESSEYIKSICESIDAQCVITVDALAAGSVRRLGTTVQMSDTGIAPGSGIGNARKRIDEKFIGVPVIAIGVPTVVDAVALAEELSGVEHGKISQTASEKCVGLTVAPKDIDLLVKNAAYLIALAINCALQTELSTKELIALM